MHRSRLRTIIVAVVVVALAASAWAVLPGRILAANGAAALQQEEEEVPLTPLTDKAFQTNKPQMKMSGCRSLSRGVKLEWEPVPGAETYQIYRAETPDSEYEEFLETEETLIKAEADGAYCYRVRAVRGELKSRWSVPLQIYCVHGYIEKMYRDRNGFTHFVCRVSNRTDQPVWFYGKGLSDAGTPDYQLLKYNIVTREQYTHPYPLTAAIRVRPGQGIVIEPRAEDQIIDIFVPEKLQPLGEKGLGDEAEAYRLLTRFYPRAETPAFQLVLEEGRGASKSMARIAH